MTRSAGISRRQCLKALCLMPFAAGFVLMVFADWLSRNLLFVGLMTMLIGGLYFVWLMLRGRTEL